MKRINAIALFAMANLALAGNAFAQAHAVKANIPFDFTVSDRLLPAGNYTIKAESHNVIVLRNLDKPIQGEDVLLVEDIVDTGLTLNYLHHMLAQRGPLSVHTVAFLDKPSRRKIEVQADYVGFVIEDRFVVGYGLDFDQKYRNLSDLCVLVP